MSANPATKRVIVERDPISDEELARREALGRRARRCQDHHACDCVTFQLELVTHALLEIEHDHGYFCGHPETCNHSACRAGYHTWAVATTALNRLREMRRGHDY